jgi:adenylate kinase family enzyme
VERIAVTGSTGSGKSTFARELARRLSVPYVELDALHWDPGWSAAPTEVFRERAAEALSADGRWVSDGNYRQVRDICWGRADTLVWLDYAFPLVLCRLTRRTLWRGLTGAELYNGNRERLWGQFCTNDSIFLWLLKSHWRRKRELPMDLAQPEYAHLRVIRCRRPRAAQAWLDRVTR